MVVIYIFTLMDKDIWDQLYKDHHILQNINQKMVVVMVVVIDY